MKIWLFYALRWVNSPSSRSRTSPAAPPPPTVSNLNDFGVFLRSQPLPTNSYNRTCIIWIFKLQCSPVIRPLFESSKLFRLGCEKFLWSEIRPVIKQDRRLTFLMPKWVDMGALETSNHISPYFVYPFYDPLVSNHPLVGWSRISMRSVRDFSVSMSTHLAIRRMKKWVLFRNNTVFTDCGPFLYMVVDK